MNRGALPGLPLLLILSACSAAGGSVPAARKPGAPFLAVEQAEEQSAVELAALERKHLARPEERQLFSASAKAAWAYVDHHGQAGTGWIAPLSSYPFSTIWDIGSSLAALYCARQLGFLDEPAYNARMKKALETLSRVRLYNGRVFNKAYDTRNGAMLDARGQAGHGMGWSSTDLGRLLLWLKIVAEGSPKMRDVAQAAVRRNDFSQVVKDGYFWGEDFNGKGGTRHTYQEGRIGYEQYAAEGFAAWGFRANHASSLTENAVPITIMGQSLPADVRQWDRLTNEPFLLLGLEAGWDRETAALVKRLLLAQQGRYQQTGRVTITGEDAIDRPPHYFYYYCVYTNGKAFGVDVQNPAAMVEGPRWVSAKSAVAFQALMPTAYTKLALQKVMKAETPAGWGSGVYENSGESTANLNINTAAVILSAALMHQQGEPLLAAARRAPVK
jgi:hypothetical protein